MKKLGPVNALYPMPTTLVGAIVDGKPNFITIAHVGILNYGTPQFISIGMAKSHYTNAGIRENGAFSICIPSEDLLVKTDYCGIMSGRNTDKAALFSIFYGDLETAPMIAECPICMECRLDRVIDFQNHDLFVGELVETYADESVIVAGRLDVSKVKPLLFDMSSRKYYAIGAVLGDCWSAGKKLEGK